ncbi:MAG: peptidylprolyl isomerase [Clostridia bacterium]|nr:peptidylprolyl isomerase [Clostridia bacterium]
MKNTFLVLTLILALLVSGFAMAETAAESDPVLATACEGELTVTLSEVKADYDEMLAYYAYMYSMYGMQVDEYDTEFQSEIAQMVVGNAIDVKVVRRWAEANGYELTDERREKIEKAAAEELAEAKEYYREYLAGSGVEGEQLEQMLEEELAAGGYSLEAFTENQTLRDIIAYVTEKSAEGITVTDEEVREQFAATIETKKKDYAESVDAFIGEYLTGSPIYVTPEGIRVVKVIYFEPDSAATDETGSTEAATDETGSTEAATDETGSTEAATDETGSTEAATDETTAGTEKKATGAERAAEALKQITEKTMTFEEAMKAYNEDTSSEEEMNRGYPVAEGSAYYSEEFIKNALALEKTGDVSEVVTTDYGYFIFLYDRDLEPGEARFEDFAETEKETLLETRKEEAYNALITKIIEDAKVETKDLTVLYHVYTGQAMSDFSAFALLTGDVSLLDKPEGEAVASVESGAAVEILGRITVNEKEYAFINVLGTEFKGYVPAEQLTETDETTAKGTDNSAKKVEAQKVESALPIFTVVMKDGSLIYGELYPAIAPETVANFVDLAGKNFYDGLNFHRVIPGFMIQGGDPNGDGTGGPAYTIKGEFSQNGVENSLEHTRGVISMARSSEFDSAGSQFFIMHADAPTLNGAYAAFGMTLGGFDTLDVIASTPTDVNDKPREDQVIRTVFVETHGETYEFTRIED